MYVLGAYPSALHVQWAPPAVEGHSLRPVRALAVDNEPSEWGEATSPPAGTNGPSGEWVDRSSPRGTLPLAGRGLGSDQLDAGTRPVRNWATSSLMPP